MTIAKSIFAPILSQFSVAEMRPTIAEGLNHTSDAIGLRLKDIAAECEEHAITAPPKSDCRQIYPGRPSSLRITSLIRALISPSDLRRSATSGSNITFNLCLRWFGCRAGRPRLAFAKKASSSSAASPSPAVNDLAFFIALHLSFVRFAKADQPHRRVSFCPYPDIQAVFDRSDRHKPSFAIAAPDVFKSQGCGPVNRAKPFKINAMLGKIAGAFRVVSLKIHQINIHTLNRRANALIKAVT